MANTMCKHEWKSSLRGAICKKCDNLRGDGTLVDGYRPRNDNVLLRVITGLKFRDLAMPDRAIEGTETIIIGIGPDNTKDLKEGDIVLCTGNLESETYLLPKCKDVVIATQKNVRCVLGNINDKKLEIADG